MELDHGETEIVSNKITISKLEAEVEQFKRKWSETDSRAKDVEDHFIVAKAMSTPKLSERCPFLESFIALEETPAEHEARMMAYHRQLQDNLNGQVDLVAAARNDGSLLERALTVSRGQIFSDLDSDKLPKSWKFWHSLH